MGSMMLAMLVVAAGVAVRVAGPALGARGNSKLLGYGLMLGGIGVGAMNTVVVIDVGEVGVKHFLGRIDPAPDLFGRIGTERQIQAKAGNRIEVLDVFLRDVQAPPRVRQAIEEKLQREQMVAAEKFQTDIVRERAQQTIEEAKGIAEAQKIITAGLTPEYLMFHYIEQLATLPAGSVVYVPTEGSIPLMRNVGGGG